MAGRRGFTYTFLERAALPYENRYFSRTAQPVNVEQALQNAGALFAGGRWAEAERLCRAILALQKNHAGAMTLLGIVTAQTQRQSEAADLWRRAIALRPDDAGVIGNYAKLMTSMGRLGEALASYERLLKLRPTSFEAYNGRGTVLHQLDRIPEALASFEQAVGIKPDYVPALFNRGVALRALGRLDDALTSYDRVLAIRPDHIDSLNNRGVVQQALGRPLQALASYERAVALRPDDAEAHCNRGAVLVTLGRLEEALESFGKTVSIKPRFALGHARRGDVLRELRRPDESLASYAKALELQPDYAEVYLNRATVLQTLDRQTEALDSLQRSIQLRPDDLESHYALGNAMMRMHRPESALAPYARALELAPDRDWLQGSLLHAKSHLCDWRDRASQVERLLANVEQGKKVVLPFYALSLTDSPALQRQAAVTFVNDRYSISHDLPDIVRGNPRDKIRLGYYSADFHEHATAHLAAGLFEHHDRARFELIAFSFGPTQNDPMRQRLTAAFDRFLEVGAQSDRDVAALSRQLEIDVAIDLKGFTEQARPGIFFHRAAPVQASYLGYPGTMGARCMDYLVADEILVPTASRRQYTEKIVYLPHSYQANDRQRSMAERRFSREELGLPATGVVFCCFNSSYKVAPETFDSWMRILARTPGSVLWLLPDNGTAASNLRAEAASRGIDPARLIFALRLPPPEHLARHRAADLFLDTLPYNAHTTASDALWAGLPVLSRCGESFAGRVAASLLTAAGMPELVTDTPESYEALAIELAFDPNRLAALKRRLTNTRLSIPLFDTELFTRHLEDAYMQMHKRSKLGLDPEHLHVRDRRELR